MSCAVFDRYSKYSKVDVAKAIDLEMKGDLESCLTALGKDPDDHRESDITVCYFVTHKLGVKV